MAWIVTKVGAPMFDALHAYGLGTLLTYSLCVPVQIRDMGTHYLVTSNSSELRQYSPDLLYKILSLPDSQALTTQAKENDVAQGNLDGLLAALFTIPGVRAVSLADVKIISRHQEDIAERVLNKVQRAITRWYQFAQKTTKQSDNWVRGVLIAYTPSTLTLPQIVNKTRKTISLTMPLDPAFSRSLSRANSDSLITDTVGESFERRCAGRKV